MINRTVDPHRCHRELRGDILPRGHARVLHVHKLRLESSQLNEDTAHVARFAVTSPEVVQGFVLVAGRKAILLFRDR